MCTENTFADLLLTYTDHPVPEFLRLYADTPIMDEILPADLFKYHQNFAVTYGASPHLDMVTRNGCFVI